MTDARADAAVAAAASSAPSSLRISDSEAVRVVTLDRPERRNALDSATVAELLAAFDAVDADDAIGAVVLTGTPPVFCAGSDVRELALTPADARGDQQGFWPRLEAAIAGCRAPVVAAVDGGAWGGGLFLAAFADLRIASEPARFAAPEVTLGWLPPGGVEALVDLVGVGTARDIVLTGRTVEGPEAHRIGLVDRLTPAGELMDAALELARSLASLPTAGVGSARHYFRARRGLERDARDRLALERFRSDVTTDDAERALARFLPDRGP